MGEEKVSVAKPLGRDPKGQGPPGVPPMFCCHQGEEGEQKVSGLGKRGWEKLGMETEQERPEGELKNSPGSVGGQGGYGGMAGREKLDWAHLDGGALGDGENSWFGGMPTTAGWVVAWGGGGAMGTAGMGSRGAHLDGRALGSRESSWRGCEGLATGTAGCGLGEQLDGRARQRWWPRLDDTYGDKGLSWLAPGQAGVQFLPSHPRSSHGGFFSFRMNLMRLPLISRSREKAAGWQERGH